MAGGRQVCDEYVDETCRNDGSSVLRVVTMIAGRVCPDWHDDFHQNDLSVGFVGAAFERALEIRGVLSVLLPAVRPHPNRRAQQGAR